MRLIATTLQLTTLTGGRMVAALLIGFVLLLDGFLAGAQTIPSASQPPEVSIKSIGFTDLGQARVVSGFLRPATNHTILGSRPSTLPGPTNFTTLWPGGPGVLFQYTNSSPYPTICFVQAMEYKTNGAWKAVPVPASAGSLLVRSNSTATQTLPVNATNVAWRITVFCVEQSTGMRRAAERGEELVKEVVTGQQTEHFSGRKYLTTSVP
jgi:hypothetical protein